MKLLSVIIPCYNSQSYMEFCLESLLSTNNNNIELIVVNDGSTDNTAQIAEKYKSDYPEVIKVIHQDNGGHGEAINTGIKNATGLYLKVVDSDDWVDKDAYEKIMVTLSEFSTEENVLDMVISNFVYEKEGAKNKKTMSYKKMLPEEIVFDWDDFKSMRLGKYILMHSVIYRTKLLQDIKLTLPKHTFYVDNLFVYVPLLKVKRMYYLNVDFYRYFIGRDDQSVNEQIMMRRIDQQLRVNRLMIEHFQKVLNESSNQKLRQYMYHYLEIMTAVSSILLINSGTKEDLIKKSELWNLIKEYDDLLYYRLRTGFFGMLVNLPGRFGRKISIGVYKISQKAVGFN